MSLPPLSVHPTNPLWFWDGTQAVYLAGSHSWNNIIDIGSAIDFEAYVVDLSAQGHNFMRLWARCLTKSPSLANGTVNSLMPYNRSATSGAGDGGNKFDLTSLNTTYFSRLRSRIQYCDSKGIYVGVMLFNPLSAWSLASADQLAWHPYASGNNVNGITGEVGGLMKNVYFPFASQPTGVAAIQQSYIDAVLDAIEDLSNVLAVEPANECGAQTETHDWQQDVIDYVRAYELANSTYQHMLWRSPEGGQGADDSTAVLASDAEIIGPDVDWVGFGVSGGVASVAANTFTRPSIYDTDHTFGFSGGTPDAVWKAGTRGHHFAYMDDYFGLLEGGPGETALNPNLATRAACGHIASYASRMNLGACTPQASLASTGFCLSDGVNDFLVYQPDSAGFTVDLSDVTTNHLRVEWINTNNGQVKRGPNISSTSATQAFTPPFAGSPSGVALFLSVPVRDVPSEGWRGVS